MYPTYHLSSHILTPHTQVSHLQLPLPTISPPISIPTRRLLMQLIRALPMQNLVHQPPLLRPALLIKTLPPLLSTMSSTTTDSRTRADTRARPVRGAMASGIMLERLVAAVLERVVRVVLLVVAGRGAVRDAVADGVVVVPAVVMAV